MSRARLGRAACAATLLAACALATSSVAAQRLARPFRCSGCISNYYYMDHDPSAGLSDWHCGRSTYNGHDGSDFSLSGGVGAIAGGHVVRAAADGVVIAAVDMNYDGCRITSISSCSSGARCTYNTTNYVVIRHADRTTRYAHLRRGSVRVAMDDLVTCGQTIGEIGSSGCSTNAHLHFEVRPRSDADDPRDPFRGTCSPRTSSLWLVQGGYRGYPGLACPTPPPPPPLDAGTTAPDAGAFEDAGAVEPDGGNTLDAASAELDAASAEPDAASAEPDAASEAGAAGADAARLETDAGRIPSLAGGCGCRAGSRSTTPATLLILLAFAGACRARRARR